MRARESILLLILLLISRQPPISELPAVFFRNIQRSYIRTGINDVVPLDWFDMFNSTELQTLLSGSEAAIDVDDWRNHTRLETANPKP